MAGGKEEGGDVLKSEILMSRGNAGYNVSKSAVKTFTEQCASLA